VKFLNINENIVLIFILFICGGILCLVLFVKINNWLRTKRLRKRFSKSRQAEKEAEKILRKNGYAIIDAQKSKPLLITIGDKIHRYLVRIDYLVRKRGKVFVVEVKSGEKIPYITNRETRRQMLEYYLAYQPCGILLLNMKNKNISEVKFQFEITMLQKVIKIVYFLLGAFFSLVLYCLLQGGRR
jgi:CRISPR/Cas system-associated exonuclease Cas4 (RecB family)